MCIRKEISIVFLIIFIFCLSSCGVKTEENKFDLEVDPNAVSMVEEKDVPEIAIPGWSSITIPSGYTNVVVDFFNPEVNENMYYLTFQLCLVDSSEVGYEVIYTSDLCEPGEHINNISLTRPLESGIYEAFVHVQPYTMDGSLLKTNNANMKVQLIVK